MWVAGQRHAPAALPLGNTRYPVYRRLGGPQGRYGRLQKIMPPPGFDPRTAIANELSLPFYGFSTRYNADHNTSSCGTERTVSLSLFNSVLRLACQM